MTTLGEARGMISIDTRGVTGAERAVKASAANMTRDLDKVGPAATRAGKGIGGLVDSVRKLDNVLGVTLAAAVAKGVFELGKSAAQADVTRGSFDKLATGVGQSSAVMLEGMRKASRGVISDSALILGANRAIVSGVADSGAELNQILEIARATGQAFGKSTTEAYGRIVQAVAKLEPELVDELGITVRLDQVFRAYAASIGTTAEQLTDLQRKQAFMNEIVKQTAPAVAAAAGAGDSAADKYERLGVSLDKAGKSLGDFLNAAGLPEGITSFGNEVEKVAERFEDLGRDITRAQDAWENFQRSTGGGASGRTIGRDRNWWTGDPTGLNEWLAGHELGERPGEGLWMIDRPFRDDPRFNASGSFGRNYSRSGIGNRSGVGANIRDPFVAAAPGINEEARQVHLDWARGVNDLNTRLHADIIGAERDYGRNRADTVADYNKSIAREERDFGRARLRAELDQLDAIADVWKSAARRESKAAEDLARAISSSRFDSDERIADARKDTNKRLAELDKDFKKEQQRREEDFRDDMLSAAGRLDAIALLELRKGRARDLREAKDAYDEQRSDLQEQLDERIADENESLQKSIRQAQEAHDRQLADAREADALRLQDMKDDFAKRKAQEDEDRAIRKQDAAIDHADQLAEMDRAHADRIQQIRDNAARERRALQEEADAELVRLKEADKATRKRVEAKEKLLEDMWDRFHKHITDSLTPGVETLDGANRGKRMTPMASGGYVPRDMAIWAHAGEYVLPAPVVAAGGMGRSVSFSGDVNITIAGGANMDAGSLRPLMFEVFVEALEEVAGR